jgi:NADP-dependent aldehyde dehydrogenase
MGARLMDLRGLSFIAGDRASRGGHEFRAINPTTGADLPDRFFSATPDELARAAHSAEIAAHEYRQLSGRDRAQFLRAVAAALDAAKPALVARAHLETALPIPRLENETARTSNQLRLFADVLDEGSWVAARIDPAQPARKPQPRVDLRSMLRPIGPVAVFGASNFPIAYSVLGGDTASALAAGNPVIVKAHPAHPGASEIAASVIDQVVRDQNLARGLFSMLFDSGIEVGRALVQHPAIKAVGFTGSLAAGRALMDLAAARPEPIPCFAEMGSTNPVFVLPGALRERANDLAGGLHASFTLGAGQFCTKPGLVFVPRTADAAQFVTAMRELSAATAPFTMLTPAIAASYSKTRAHRAADPRLQSATAPDPSQPHAASAVLYETAVSDLLADASLSEEMFGPTTLLVHYEQREDMLRAARELRGHLTATILGTDADFADYSDLIAILEQKAGRVIFNGFPTGVEVGHAIIHGGPYPAASDSRFTSVGSAALLRWARPVCYQNSPAAQLPPELADHNPLGIFRLLDGTYTRDPLR